MKSKTVRYSLFCYFLPFLSVVPWIAQGMDDPLWKHYKERQEYVSENLTYADLNNVLDFLREKLQFDFSNELSKLADHITETLQKSDNTALNHFVLFDTGVMFPQKSYFVFYKGGGSPNISVMKQTLDFIFKNGVQYNVAVEKKREQFQIVLYIKLKEEGNSGYFFYKKNPFSLIWSNNDGTELGLVSTVKIPLDIVGFQKNQEKNRLFATAYPECSLDHSFVPFHKNLDFFGIDGTLRFGAEFYAINALIEGQSIFWKSYTDEYIIECLRNRSAIGETVKYMLQKNLSPQTISYAILEGAVGFGDRTKAAGIPRDVVPLTSHVTQLETENIRLKDLLQSSLIQNIQNSFQKNQTLLLNILDQFLICRFKPLSTNPDDGDYLKQLETILQEIKGIEKGSYNKLHEGFEAEFTKFDSERYLSVEKKQKLINILCSEQNSAIQKRLEGFKSKELFQLIKKRLEKFLQDIEEKVDAITDTDIETIKEIVRICKSQPQELPRWKDKFFSIINNTEIAVLYEKGNAIYVEPLLHLCANSNIDGLLKVVEEKILKINKKRSKVLNDVAKEENMSLDILNKWMSIFK